MNNEEIESSNEKMEQLSRKQAADIQSTIGLSKLEFKTLKKKLKRLKGRDDKAFMDMLRVTSRNHYTLNQMVDRKARILLTGNVLFLTLIIGGNISAYQEVNNWRFGLMLFFGIICIISIIFSMMAVKPEKLHGSLTEENIKQKKGNALFFGNFKNLTEEVYENTMMEMVNDRDFIYRSMIQDIYHLGKILERKRQFLRTSLYVFAYGLCISLLVSFVLRLIFG